MKLSDTQLIILSAASQRQDHAVVLPANLKGNAAKKVADKLLGEALVQELPAKDAMPVWRRDDDNRAYSLRITKAGLKSIGLEGPDAPVQKACVDSAIGARQPALAARSKVPMKRRLRPGKTANKRGKVAARKNAGKKRSRKDAAGSKQDSVLALLRAPEGASIDALVKATAWQKHSVRGFLAGTVRKKLKLPLVSEKVDGVRTYRIGKAKPAKDAKAAPSRAA